MNPKPYGCGGNMTTKQRTTGKYSLGHALQEFVLWDPPVRVRPNLEQPLMKRNKRLRCNTNKKRTLHMI